MKRRRLRSGDWAKYRMDGHIYRVSWVHGRGALAVVELEGLQHWVTADMLTRMEGAG